MSTLKRFMPVFALSLAVVLISEASAQADFSLGDASNYGVLGLKLTSAYHLNGTLVNGNIGIGSGGTLTATSGTVNGNIDFFDPVTSSNYSPGSLVVTGAVSGNVAKVGTAASAAQTLSTSAAAEAATTTVPGNTISNLTGAQTINAKAGADGNTVVNLTDLTILGGTLTLKGGANDYFILNISGKVLLNGGAIKLDGVGADHVLFNVEGTGTSGVNLQGGGTYNGIFLAEQRDFLLDTSTTVNGRIIGAINHTIDLSGGTLNQPASLSAQGVAPEPESFTLLAIGGVGLLGFVAWRKRRQPVLA